MYRKSNNVSMDDIVLKNRTWAWKLSANQGVSEDCTALEQEVKHYNEFLAEISGWKGFSFFFEAHHLDVTREDVAGELGVEKAELLFSMKQY